MSRPWLQFAQSALGACACMVIGAACLATPPAPTPASIPATAAPATALPPPTAPAPTAAPTANPPTAVPAARQFPFAAPPTDTIYGIDIFAIDAAGGLDYLTRSQSTWTRRLGVRWASIEPNKGERKWEANADFERELRNAASANVRVVVIVGSTPGWAQAGSTAGWQCGPIQPAMLDAFGAFMEDTVRRYSAAPFNVRDWELWNEPDVDARLVAKDSGFGCWGNEDDPYYGGGGYARMLKAAYPRMKAASPDARVFVGGLLMACNPNLATNDAKCNRAGRFMEGVLRDGGGPFFDGISFHAYDYYYGTWASYANPSWGARGRISGPVVISKTRYLEQVLNTYTVTGKLLINSETALLNVPCGQCSGGDANFESTKAIYAAQALAAAHAEGLTAAIWYNLSGWRGSALVSGTVTTPAFAAFGFARRLLASPAYEGAIEPADVGGAPNIAGYRFKQSAEHVWVLWSQDAVTRSVTLNRPVHGIWDVAGVTQTVTSTVSLGFAPIYAWVE